MLVVAISERHWGRRIGLQAAQAAMRLGFEVLELKRLLATVDIPNDRSHRLMTRLGFAAIGKGQGPKYRYRTYQAGCDVADHRSTVT